MKTMKTMKGGGKCKLCGSQGTLSTTCPLNPKAKKPNPNKHPNAKKELLLLTKSSSNKTSSNKTSSNLMSSAKSSNKTSSSERKRMKSFMDGLPSAKSSAKSSTKSSSNLHYYLVHKETGKTYDIKLDDMSVILVLGDGSKQPKATFRSRAKAIEYIEEQVERMTKLGYETVSGKAKTLSKTLTLPSNKSLSKTKTYVDTSEIPDQNCTKYRKFKAPKCNDQQSCEWVKKEGKKPGHCKKKLSKKLSSKKSSSKKSSKKSSSKKSSSKKSSSKKFDSKKSSSYKPSSTQSSSSSVVTDIKKLTSGDKQLALDSWKRRDIKKLQQLYKISNRDLSQYKLNKHNSDWLISKLVSVVELNSFIELIDKTSSSPSKSSSSSKSNRSSSKSSKEKRPMADFPPPHPNSMAANLARTGVVVSGKPDPNKWTMVKIKANDDLFYEDVAPSGFYKSLYIISIVPKDPKVPESKWIGYQSGDNEVHIGTIDFADENGMISDDYLTNADIIKTINMKNGKINALEIIKAIGGTSEDLEHIKYSKKNIGFADDITPYVEEFINELVEKHNMFGKFPSSKKSSSKKSSSKKLTKKSPSKKSSSKKQSPGIDYFISTLFKILKEKNCHIFKVGVVHEVSEDELHKKIEENMKEIYDPDTILKTINQFLNAWNKCVEDSGFEWSIRDIDEGKDDEMDDEVLGELEDRYMKDFPEAYAAEGRGYPSSSKSS